MRDTYKPKSVGSEKDNGKQCHWCEREEPCDCGPNGRCKCTCGDCQSENPPELRRDRADV